MLPQKALLKAYPGAMASGLRILGVKHWDFYWRSRRGYNGWSGDFRRLGVDPAAARKMTSTLNIRTLIFAP